MKDERKPQPKLLPESIRAAANLRIEQWFDKVHHAAKTMPSLIIVLRHFTNEEVFEEMLRRRSPEWNLPAGHAWTLADWKALNRETAEQLTAMRFKVKRVYVRNVNDLQYGAITRMPPGSVMMLD